MRGNCLRISALLAALGSFAGCSPPTERGAISRDSKSPGQIALVRGSHLYLIKPDGSAEREIASNVAEEMPIEWSRNGRFIIYSGIAQGGVSDLWAIETDRHSTTVLPANLTRLTSGVARSPAISPDSKRVAFMRDQPAGLYVLTLGSVDPPRRLTHDGQLDQIPTWSPDGKSIVYGELVFTDESAVEKFRMQLLIAKYDPASAGVAPATPIPAGDGASDSPALSPMPSDSPYALAFRAHRRGNDEIALLDPVHLAAPEINLTKSWADEHDPVWSPDGARLAFWRRTKTAHELWTFRPDGTDAVQVCTLRAEPAPGPVEWSGDSRQIAFSFAHAHAGILIVESAGGIPRRIGDGTQIKWR